jgi:hypothetical protein
MKIGSKILKLIVSFVLLMTLSTINAQNAQEVFGKNKVQYSDDLNDWWIYETNNFVVYWYGKSRPIAQFCIEIAETENFQFQKLFEYHLKDKIELVIYTDATDLKQSNIDLDGFIDIKSWKNEPKIKENKILIYFDGNHHHLRNLLRSGIIQLYFNSMFTGTALQDVVQQVISLRLPEWFEKGLIQYLTTGWKLENQLEFYKHWNQTVFKKMSSRYPELAGQSFWNFLISTYGEQAISNWLYMTRIQKDIHTAAQLVFSVDFNDLQSDWFDFYKNQLITELPSETDKTKVKLKSEEDITAIYNSLDPAKYIITTTQNGKTRVRVLDNQTGTSRCIFKKGSRSKLHKTDLNYPIYFSSDDYKYSYIIYERRNKLHLTIYDKDYKLISKHLLPEDFQTIYSAVSYNKDAFICSANTNGFSDIIHYNIKTRQYKKITNDIWDDLDVSYSNHSGKIIFRSNRPDLHNIRTKLDSTLPLSRFSLYSVRLDEKLNTLKELDIPGKNILLFTLHNSNYLVQIEEPERNRNLIVKNDTIYEMLDFQFRQISSITGRSDTLHYVFPDQDKWYYKQSILLKSKLKMYHSTIQQQIAEQALEDPAISENTDTLFFQSKFGNPPNIQSILSEFNTKSQKNYQIKYSSFSHYNAFDYPTRSEFNSNLAIAYRNRFQIEDLSSTVNNDVLFSGLNTFSGTSQLYEPPPFGLLLKTKLRETFENFSLEGGLRIPFTFNGLEAYILYENRKQRFDHGIALYYKSMTEITGSNVNSNFKRQDRTFLINHQLKYALDHYKSLRAITTLRNDHSQYLSTNQFSLYDSADVYQQRIGTRLEYVFDNALDVSLNIKNGWQLKVFYEISKRFSLNPETTSRFFPGFLMLAGMDARLHLPVLTKSVFANRCYVNTSFGRDRILYHVGGTENWILPRYENQSPLETSGQYVYHALATEVRSYGYGARKAGSVFGLSSELRIPFLQYLISKNWKNNVLRNFQIVPFFDLAYVWDGLFPDFDNSSTLDFHAENPVVKIDLQYSRTPLIMGTGIGMRTSLFGYFVRFDYAWRLEDFTLKDPGYSFSLGLDF